MKLILTAGLLLASVAFAGQGSMNPPVPKEMKKIEFFLGKWSGTEKMQGMGGGSKPMNVKGMVTGVKTLGGHYIQSMHSSDMGQMGKMQGMHLMSYDTFKKQYVGFWFDSSSPGVMEMSGNFQGDKLIMISKPVEIPGMPEPMTMRATWQKKPGNKVWFLLENKEGTKWTPLIEGNYKKIG